MVASCLIQNIVINICEKFHNDQLRNDRALADRKSDKKKNNENKVCSAWRPVYGSKNTQVTYLLQS